ncbi:MAG: hypothetical protein QOD61_1188 [Solirubrobacteraceae bacterium]|nr:hypothetical protein [Solirubrobacteraceae bacterium]
MRSFDPRRVGELECTTWVTYYRREWPAFLRAALAVTRHAFGLPWPDALRGAWLVLRANQVWAPYPDNDPEAARRHMLGFYRLVAARHHESFDVETAARLEVDWWRIHREVQHGSEPEADSPVVEALVALYRHVYTVPPETVRQAAAERALAMRISDQWVDEGCALESPLIPRERAALVRSYAALLAAVHRPG